MLDKKLILASSSPRRHELLNQVKISFTIQKYSLVLNYIQDGLTLNYFSRRGQ
ncbi:Maf family protein [Virgibacillus dakarensis]|uniref:Maf family protein n=1 Tax=Virgibacillus dakarensis TaxID=1917889 RepID=UPI0022862DE4|nr:Maf family protein [Virgibacillus dakarensis]